MTDSSRRPDIAICSVRGIGVAVRVRTWTSSRSAFSLSLWVDPEMLLLVDNDQAQLLELDRFRQQRMGADDDVDRALLEPFLGRLGLGRGDQPRQAADLDREALEALDEVRIMLAGEQGGRADQRDLIARHRRDERGAQRHLGLAEADVAAHQPVHRLAAPQIVEHLGDRPVLVVGLLIGEAVDERGIAAVGLGDLRRGGWRGSRRS